MDLRGVDFLKRLLKDRPDLGRFVSLDPPRVRRKGRWWPLKQWRLGAAELLLETSAGHRIRVAIDYQTGRRRRGFQKDFLSSLARREPRWKPVKILECGDRPQSRKGPFLRVLLQNGGRRRALIAVPSGETSQSSAHLLTAAVLWWSNLREQARPERLRIFVPWTWSDRLLHLLPYLRIPLSCFRHFIGSAEARREGPFERIYPGPLSTALTPPDILFPYRQVPAALSDLVREMPDLDLVFRAGHWELSYKGLRLASEGGEQALFGLRRPRPLDSDSMTDFRRMVAEVRRFRTFPVVAGVDRWFQRLPERWLESLVRGRPRLIDPGFVSPFYSQVPTCFNQDRKVIDALTVTRNGRLAVLEMKVEKDLDLLFQGLDYWDRVRHHQLRGDLQRSGYFSGHRLKAAPPHLYLISPLFEFHRLLPRMSRYLTGPERIVAIGLNSDWRNGLRVLRRQRIVIGRTDRR